MFPLLSIPIKTIKVTGTPTTRKSSGFAQRIREITGINANNILSIVFSLNLFVSPSEIPERIRVRINKRYEFIHRSKTLKNEKYNDI